jgi:hypothetical protein
MLQTCIWAMPVLILAGTQTILTGIFHDFPQSLQANVRVVSENMPHFFHILSSSLPSSHVLLIYDVHSV